MDILLIRQENICVILLPGACSSGRQYEFQYGLQFRLPGQRYRTVHRCALTRKWIVWRGSRKVLIDVSTLRTSRGFALVANSSRTEEDCGLIAYGQYCAQ